MIDFTELENLKSGNTYFIKKGVYKDVEITITGDGREDNYITIEGGNDVVFEGKTSITIKGSYIVFKGFDFNGCSGNKIIKLEGDNLRFTNNEINGMGNDMETYLLVKGQYCRVDNNTFRNFDKVGCIVYFQNSKKKSCYGLLDGNNFNNRKLVKDATLSMVIVGNIKYPLLSSRVLVYNNFFNSCNGNVEIISVRSCDNIILSNKITSCEGYINLKQGQRNKVIYNFLCGDLCNENFGGIKVFDKDHSIIGNTFDTLITTNPLLSPVSILCDSKNIKVMFNDFLQCYYCLSLGVSHNDNNKPTKLLIKNNRAVKCRGFFLTDDKNLGYDDSTITENEILKRDIRLRLVNGNKLNKVNVKEFYEEKYNHKYLEDDFKVKPLMEMVIIGESKNSKLDRDDNKDVETMEITTPPKTPFNSLSSENLVIEDDDDLETIDLNSDEDIGRESLLEDIFNSLYVLREFRKTLIEYKKVEDKKRDMIDKLIKLLK